MCSFWELYLLWTFLRPSLLVQLLWIELLICSPMLIHNQDAPNWKNCWKPIGIWCQNIRSTVLEFDLCHSISLWSYRLFILNNVFCPRDSFLFLNHVFCFQLSFHLISFPLFLINLRFYYCRISIAWLYALLIMKSKVYSNKWFLQ